MPSLVVSLAIYSSKTNTTGDINNTDDRATTDMELWRLDRGTFKEVVVSSTMATRRRREEFLSKVPVLVTMSTAEISALADNAMEIEFPEGTTLMEEGEK